MKSFLRKFCQPLESILSLSPDLTWDFPRDKTLAAASEAEATWCDTHRNKSHPKTPTLKSISKEKRYSACVDKNSESSEGNHSVLEEALQSVGEKKERGKSRRILKGLDSLLCFREGVDFFCDVFHVFRLVGDLGVEVLATVFRFSFGRIWGLKRVFSRESAGIKVLSIHCYLLVIIVGLDLIFCSFFSFSKACSGRFVNPITDICWSCLFPISIGPVKVNTGGREDTDNPHQIPCLCPRPPLPVPVPGIPVGFWEPARLVDVTRIPYCMVSMGGLQLGRSLVNHGVHGSSGERKTQHSFYQVHWYLYPVIYWLELLTDFLCLEKASFDVGYITELDPLWNADELSFILNPEAILFGNPIAQAACAADCAATSAGFPQDMLFWCGGCQGSLYPFTGNNAAHNGGVQASLLMTQRIMAKLHRELLLWGTSGTSNHQICQKYPLPIIKKTQYKTQMTYPRPTTRGPMACNPLGRTEVIWGSGREFPYKGEDFGYLIWRKRNCCLF